MVPSAALAQSSQPIDQRKALYAPWSPDQMAQRRKEYGLIGPGTTRQVPPPAFPSYLKKPESVEALMPQARAAVRQTGGRTPLGLVLPGKHVLIVVGEIRDTVPDMMVQEAIKRAFEERGVKCTILTTWDTLGLSQQEYMEFREGIRTYTIGDGQRELESFFTTTGFMPNAQKGRDWVRRERPGASARDLAGDRNSPNERFAKLAKELFEATPNALVAWLDKHPEDRLDRVAQRQPAELAQDAPPPWRKIPWQLHLSQSLRPDEPGPILPVRRLASGRDQDHGAACVRRPRRGHRSGRHRLRL